MGEQLYSVSLSEVNIDSIGSAGDAVRLRAAPSLPQLLCSSPAAQPSQKQNVQRSMLLTQLRK